MKIILLIFTTLSLLIIQVQVSYSQINEESHTFKITGRERIPVYIGDSQERSVEYDSNSANHLYISDFRKNGFILEKTQFLFKGKKFNLTNLNDYILREELMKDGIQNKYREDESLVAELIYKENKLLKQTIYYSNGNKQLMFESDDNILNGPLKMWYPDGRQSFSGNYKNNLKDGVFESFDQSENISRKGIYKGGKLVSGESVVQDLVYDEPDVPARFIGGDNAFNDYLKRKTADFTAAKKIDKDNYRVINLRLTISKEGLINKFEIISWPYPADQEIVNAAFREFPGFEPALLESVPVRSILNLNLLLTNKGLQTNSPDNDLIVEVINDSINNSADPLAEEMPEFPGGQLALRKFIAQNVRYPIYAQEHGIQGKVFVKYVIQEDGTISNIAIARSVHPILDAEAVRVVKLMPKWIAGRQSGKAVRVSYTVPVNFVLQ